LTRVGSNLLLGIAFSAEPPQGEIDLAIALGDAAISVTARGQLRLTA